MERCSNCNARTPYLLQYLCEDCRRELSSELSSIEIAEVWNEAEEQFFRKGERSEKIRELLDFEDPT